MRVDASTLYELPHGFSHRRLLCLRIQLAILKALSCADFPVLGRVFLLISVKVKTDASTSPIQVPQVFPFVVTIKHGEVLSEVRVNFDALWQHVSLYDHALPHANFKLKTPSILLEG